MVSPRIPRITFKRDWRIEIGYQDDGTKTFTFFSNNNGVAVRTAKMGCCCDNELAFILEVANDVIAYEEALPND